MNVGTIGCLLLSGLFLLLALAFALGKEKAASWISGFNSMLKEEQEQYDRKRMSEDQRNSLLIWSCVFLVGAVFCAWISVWIVVPTIVLWLILFFKDVHMDEKKAFEKYRKGSN